MHFNKVFAYDERTWRLLSFDIDLNKVIKLILKVFIGIKFMNFSK